MESRCDGRQSEAQRVGGVGTRGHVSRRSANAPEVRSSVRRRITGLLRRLPRRAGLLFTAGIEPKSHRGLIALVGEHFVKPGRLSPELGRVLSRMQRDREDADYLSGAVFTPAETAEMLTRAEQFLAEVRRLVAPRNPDP